MSESSSPLVPPTQRPVPTWGIWSMFGLFVSLTFICFMALIEIWPDNCGNSTGTSFFYYLPITGEQRLLILAAVAGLLGSLIHVSGSFSYWVANGGLTQSWIIWYLLRPIVGMLLALLLYFTFRGGLLSIGPTQSGAGQLEACGIINPFGLAAVSGLAGLFSKQATRKLAEVFDTLFKVDQPEGEIEEEKGGQAADDPENAEDADSASGVDAELPAEADPDHPEGKTAKEIANEEEAKGPLPTNEETEAEDIPTNSNADSGNSGEADKPGDNKPDQPENQ